LQVDVHNNPTFHPNKDSLRWTIRQWGTEQVVLSRV
jgi:hypothetical protein